MRALMPSFSHAHRPLHVLYGGAHLWNRDTLQKLALRARESMEGWDDAAFAEAVGVKNLAVGPLVRAKLERQAIDSYCIDFEDGYGPRSKEEEDADAVRAGEELAATPPGALVGIRIKSFGYETRSRALHTLDKFLAAMGTPRAGFSVTLPKVMHASEVTTLAKHLEERGFANIGLELMIETPTALRDARTFVIAGRSGVTAVHLGAYDLTAELGVGPSDQTLAHPYNQFARMMLKMDLPEIAISDGATTQLPVGSREDVARGWRLHADNIRNATRLGIWQGWDLHPAQLPARWAAVFSTFLTERDELAKRLANFVSAGARRIPRRCFVRRPGDRSHDRRVLQARLRLRRVHGRGLESDDTDARRARPSLRPDHQALARADNSPQTDCLVDCR